MAFQGQFGHVVFWVLLATVFDFFDGFVARLLKVSSPLGVELDSLADAVSFGVAPSITTFILIRDYLIFPSFAEPLKAYIPYLAFLLAVFSAYRLAKFNIDTRQTSSFLGLPTPANALFWISYCYSVVFLHTDSEAYFFITLLLILVFCVLLVCELPMFSFKIKEMRFKGNRRQLLLLLISLIAVIVLDIRGLSIGVLAYILISFFTARRRYE